MCHNTHRVIHTTDAQTVRYTNSFGFGHGIPALYNWRCFGNETNLNDCLQSTSSCFDSYRGIYRLTGVFCHGKVLSGKKKYLLIVIVINR